MMARSMQNAPQIGRIQWCKTQRPPLLYSAGRCQVRSSQPNHARPAVKAQRLQAIPLFGRGHSFAPACIKPVLPRTGDVKDGAATAKGGVSLTAPRTAACWMPLGPRKVFDAARRALLLFGMGTAALPVWDEEDETERSEGRPYRCSAAGTNCGAISLHPSSREGHLPPDGGNSFWRFSACASPAAQSRRCSLVLRPAELRAVNPDTVHDHGKPARQRHDGTLQPAVPGNVHGPGFEP